MARKRSSEYRNIADCGFERQMTWGIELMAKGTGRKVEGKKDRIQESGARRIERFDFNLFILDSVSWILTYVFP